MNILAATLDAIAARAPDADRQIADDLMVHLTAVDAAAKSAISIGTLSGVDLIDTREARGRALEALENRINAIMARQQRLICHVPTDRRSRRELRPVASPALLVSLIEAGADRIGHLARNHGEVMVALRNGAKIGEVGAHETSIQKGELVVSDIGRWPLSRIEAVAIEDGLAVLLDDGTLIEVQAA